MNIHFLDVLRRWLWLMILATLVCGATAFWFVKNQPIYYEANTKLLIGPGVDSPDPDLNSLRAGGQLMQTYAELIDTGPLLQTVIDTLHLETDTSKLSQKIDVKFNADTQILSVTIKDEDPAATIAIANAVAEALVAISPSGSTSPSRLLRNQMDAQAKDLENAITQSKDTVTKLELDLNAYSTTRVLTATEAATKKSIEQQLASERDRLTQMRSTLTTLYDGLGKTNTNQVKIIEKANSSIKVNSNLKIYILAAAMAGLLLCLAFIIAYEYFDDTIKTSKELEDLTGIPILTTIPRLPPQRRDEKLAVKDQSNSLVAETYRLLGTMIIPLLGLNILDDQADAEKADQTVGTKIQSNRTLLITNIQAGNDSSYIAGNLAIVLSQIGIKTILVDSDFHQPKMSALFSVPGEKGLYTMLNTHSRETLTKNLQVISPNLSVLPSGSIPSQNQRSSSFFELLVSRNMEDLIKQLKNKAKTTILVAPPLTSYSESMILASRVDSVLLVGHEYRTKRRKVIQTLDNLRAYGVQPVGIIMKQKQPNALWKNFQLVISSISEAIQTLALKIRQRGSGINSVPLKRKA